MLAVTHSQKWGGEARGKSSRSGGVLASQCQALLGASVGKPHRTRGAEV
jgi:hypothetical protein